MKTITTQKRLRTFVTMLLVFFAASWLLPLTAFAQNATAYTYTVSVDGYWVRTQDAYLAGTLLLKDLGVKKPEDLYITNEKLYVADTGSKRIVVMDRKTGAVTYMGEDVLSAPTGVFVNNDGNLLVADNGLGKVALMSADGKVLQWFERPDSPIFGQKTTYKPRKAVSDKKGNIYIISEGSYDGIIQLSREGEFLGYFGANQTVVSPLEAIQDLLFTDQQKSQLFNRIPKTFYNIAIDQKGMVYSITQSLWGAAIKKHNVSGSNILYSSGKMLDEQNFVDIAVGRYGQIYTITETGLIYEYDSTGQLVFSFGGRAISSERNGLFTVASGITVDENDNVYVLDRERGVVQVFYPTAFAQATHQAISLYENGRYEESKAIWQEILRVSGISRMAHNGMGKGYFQAGDYEKAATHFKIARNQEDYSQAYWEIRNQWLQKNAGWILIGLVLLLLLRKAIQRMDKKHNILAPVRFAGHWLKGHRWVEDVLFIKNFIRHPIDSYYDIRKDKKGSVLSASIIYFLALVVFTADYLFRGFILNPRDASEVSYLYVMILFLAPCTLWVAGNYMVSSINEGEGRLKDVYIATAYSFAPMILFMPLVTLLSYVITLNEEFIISFSTMGIWIWCAVAMFLGLKEIHDYEVWDVIKNILLTLFFMFIVILALSIIYMLWDQGAEFIYSIVKEVAYRVQ